MFNFRFKWAFNHLGQDVKRLIAFLKKWTPYFTKGASAIPSYFAYWGFLRANKRIIKAIFLTGFTELNDELQVFKELYAAPLPVSRRPDYVIMAPDFASNSAGIWSLYQITWELKQLGFETAVTGSQVTDPNHPTPLISISDARAAAKAGSWIIYPETISGNPLGAANVIRWVLNQPGLLGGDKVYDERELVFIYSEVFAPYVQNKITGKLYLPTLNQALFYPPHNEEGRTLELSYAGKSLPKSGYFNPKETFEITRTTPPKTELGKLFRAARVLYSFDNSTALIYEALLCGCPVVIIPDGTQTWADYQTLELGTDGLYWGKPEIMPKPFHPEKLLDRISKSKADFLEQLGFMVATSQKLAPSGSLAFAKNSLVERSKPATDHVLDRSSATDTTIRA